MAEEDSIDIANDSHSLFELEIESDSVMGPSPFEPQHSTSSEDESNSNMAQNPPEEVEANANKTTRSCLDNRDWCTCINCLTSFFSGT